MRTYSIKDLEKLSGVKAHTIRIWEQRYHLLEPMRSETNIRSYSDMELKKLLRLNILYNNGFKISKIADLTEKQITQRIEELLNKDNTDNNVIESLTISMIDMDEARFERVLNDYIDKHSFDKLMLNIVYPFLDRIGVLWMTNVIDPAQEHFITNLVRQKIVAAIDELGPCLDENAKTVISFLNADEMHELGLLYYSYQLKKHGFKVIYLGQMVPKGDVMKAIDTHQPAYVLTSFINSTEKGWIDEYLKEILDSYPTLEVLSSGIQSATITLRNDRLHRLSHVNDLVDLIKNV
ncbi:MerR family transcriptional regulator [Parvicella tangerina]|uniref:HTH-type transcriptional repressor CarH n=1 Tax=Parvicella tangerina TaxID=2829795 RepID=A0A916JQV9_9FLAO|nr:MerR family transcriptional regulator [Parvicella tangerina]CAG5086534.1 HTH-type transcriptional repressor CarH [Parvicella tangerina]